MVLKRPPDDAFDLYKYSPLKTHSNTAAYLILHVVVIRPCKIDYKFLVLFWNSGVAQFTQFFFSRDNNTSNPYNFMTDTQILSA